jgi:hypothetical protein
MATLMVAIGLALPAVAAAAAVTPHADYTKSTELCAVCHDPHDAYTAKYIFSSAAAQADGELGVCYSCHDGGGGADTNVKTGPNSFSGALASGHAVENTSNLSAADLTNVCSSCHTPHKDPAGRQSLFASKVNSVTITAADNTWCFACHNDAQAWYTTNKYGSSYPPLSNPTRDATGYPIFGTFPGPTTYTNAVRNAHDDIPASSGATTRVAGDCLYCHVSHRSASAYDSLVATFQPSTASLDDRVNGTFAAACFVCHDGSWVTTGAVNVKQYVTFNGASTATSTLSGHRVKSSGASLPVNAPLPCYECHNPHGSSLGNGHLLSDALGRSLDTTTDAGVRGFCFTCHTSSDNKVWDSTNTVYVAVDPAARVVGLLRAGGNSGAEGDHNWLLLEGVSGHASGDTQSCYACHGSTYGVASASNNVHNPSPGLSTGGSDCYSCHSVYQSPMEDNLGTRTGATRTDFYHHVMGGNLDHGAYKEGDYAPGVSGAYPTDSVGGDALFCVTCHVDHDKFNANKAANLRANPTVNPSTGTNKDYDPVGDTGLCYDCHSGSSYHKNLGDTKSDGTTQTVYLGPGDFQVSSHQYEVTSTFNDGSVFYANCSKCHGGEDPKIYQTGAEFGLHFSSSRRLLSALGATQVDQLGSGFCFRCHSRVEDAVAGTKKPVNGRDWYGTKGATITSANEYVWQAFSASMLSTHPVDSNFLCENCHNPHVASETTVVVDPDDTYVPMPYDTATATERSDFCLRCHDGVPPVYTLEQAPLYAYVPATVTITLTGADKSEHADTSHWTANGSISSGEAVACGDCHDNHGSTLPKLLGEFAGGATATNTINGVGLGGNDNSVCYACHTGASALAASPSKTASGYPTDGTWPGLNTYRATYNPTAHTGSIHTAVGMVWPGTPYPYGDCKNCHDVHGTASTYDELRTQDASGTYDYDQADFSFCFNCHGADGPSTKNIKQYFPTSVGGSATQTSNTRFGHKTLSPGNLPAASAMPCYDCHNPHGSSAAYGLQVVTQTGTNTTVTIGDSAGEIAMSPADQTTASNVRNFCFSCHTTYDTSSGWNGSAMAVVGGTAKSSGISRTTYSPTGGHLRLPLANGHYLADTTRSCFTCHGDVHNPSPGLSDGGQACYGCHGAYQSPMEDGAGSKIGDTRASFYHHVLGGAAGEGDIAPNASTYPTSTTDVYCVSCHTDHNYFNNRQAGNLRSEITNSSGAATLATDFLSGSGVATIETVTASLYASVTSPTPVTTWANSWLSTGSPDGNYARSNVSGPFTMEHFFTGFPTDWASVTSATVTARARGNQDGWGRSASVSATATKLATANPVATNMRGSIIAPTTYANMQTSDNTYLQLREDANNPNRLRMEFQSWAALTEAPDTRVTQILVTMEVRCSTANVDNLFIDFWDYSAGTPAWSATYNRIGPAGGLPNADTTYQVSITNAADILRFLDASGNFRIRLQDQNSSAQAGATDNGQHDFYIDYWDVKFGYTNTTTNDDQWAIRYSPTGTAWTDIKASGVQSSTTFQDYAATVSGLTTANASSFRVLTTAVQGGGAWDSSGTVDWDASRLDLTYTRWVQPRNGVCVSCHKTSLAKQGQGSDQAGLGAANTPAISIPGFSDSSHNYAVSSTFGDSTTFSANCSKCHSDEQAKEFQTSTYKFGTHWSASVGILRALGVFVGNPPKQEACYACHNATAAKYGETLSAEAKSTQGEFAMLSKHDLTKVTCVNCHNVHEATVTAPAADPYNTYNAASLTTTVAINAYCLKCHDGTTPTQLSNDTTLVPWTVSANATANIGAFYSTDGHGSAGANVDCRECHEQHGSTLVHLLTSPVDGQAVSSYTDTDDQAQCLSCHRSGGIGAAANIARYYPTTAHGTATQADNPTWTRFGHRTKTAGTLTAGSALPCRQCHNPHGGPGTGYMLTVRTQVAAGVDTLIGDSPGELWMSDTTQTPANTIYVRRFCFTCHTDSAGGYGWNGSIDAVVPSGSTVLGIDRVNAGAVLHLPTLPNGIKGHALADTTYSCYLCHGDDFTASNSVNVHNPASGESPGGIPCYTCHTVYQDRMEDGSGSAVGGGRTLTYHHVLGSATLQGDTITYPTSSGSKQDVFCLSCHVDHNLFSPFVNPSFKRSANLRTALGASAPSSASDATSTDFVPGGSTLTVSNARYATGYTDTSGNWTNDGNVLGAPDSVVASSSTNNSFQLRSTFTFPSPLTTISEATLTVLSRAVGGWGGGGSTANVVTAIPDADVTTTNWTRNSGTNGYYTYVDDPVASPDDAGTYVYTATNNAPLDLGTPAFSIPANATNIVVDVISRDADNGNTGTNAYQVRLRVGANWYTHATSYNTAATWTPRTSNWANNPAGGAWSGTSVNQIQGVGLISSDSAPNPWVTQLYVRVTYDVPPANDDQWSIGYSVNGGTSWTSFVASSTTSEASLTDHTVNLNGILTAANSASFMVRILGGPVGLADSSGTIAWDASTLQLKYTYPNTAGNGICMTCHSLALDKDTTNQKYEANSSHTPTLSAEAFGASAHTYVATSTFTDDSTFRADCSKCHDSEIDGGGMERGASTTGFQTSTYKFSVHYSAARRILGAMGVAVSDPPAEENVCYACHSTSSDGFKSVADHDWYNVIGMSTVPQSTFDLIYGASAGATTASNVLYFRPTTDATPSEPMPNAHQTGDTFAGGTWIGRLMAPGASSVTYETKTQALGTATGNWQMVTFTSPSVADTVTLPAGNWTINIYALESNAAANAYVRYQIYEWNANDTKGAAANAVATGLTELPTGTAPGAVVAVPVAGSAMTLYPGDKISVCLEIYENVTTSYNGSFYWGSGAASNLTMPTSVNFTWARTAGAAHYVASYSGIHRPSSQDETRGYISANKHVECADCHNVHEAQPTRHTQNTNLVSGALKGVSGAQATFSSSSWTIPTNYSLIATATYEYQICFKCHSGFNQNTQNVVRGTSFTQLITWGGTGAASWTDQGLEFSTSNQSYHPVVAALPATDPGVNGSSILAADDMRASFTGPDGATYGGWANGSVMYCSDCHAQSNAGSLGPHGSSVKWMLKGPNQAWPYTTAAGNGTSSGTYRSYSIMDDDIDTANGLFCRNCHDLNGEEHTYGDHQAVACVNCHIRVPHGSKVSRLLRAGLSANVPIRYSADGAGNWPTGGVLTGVVKQEGGAAYGESDCFQSGCGQHGSSGGEQW